MRPHSWRERQLERTDVVASRLRGLDALGDQVVGAAALVLQPPQELDDLGVLLSRDPHDVVRLRRVADDRAAAARLLLDLGALVARLLPRLLGLRLRRGGHLGRLGGGCALDVGGAAAQDEHQQCHGRRDRERGTHVILTLSVGDKTFPGYRARLPELARILGNV